LPDGCIKAVNPLGQYAYITLENEIALQTSYSGYQLSFLEQIQAGGGITAGNKRYSIRFITESGNATELSLLTNPIPVYAPQYLVDTDKIYGTQGNGTTGKINRLELTGIMPGLFKFVELICFNYQGNALPTVAVSAQIIRREPLSEDQESIVLEHNGNEVGIVNFDAALANQVQPDIVRAKDLTLIQNRLVLGSVTTSPEYDLTEFCKTIKYSIKRFPLFGAFGAQTFYEFYNPESVTNRVGYQVWEWYRFYIVGELLSGKLTQAFFAFDARLVSQTDYTNNPDYGQTEFLSTNVTNRRDFNGDDFVDYDLMSGNNEYYQYYFQIKGFDWDFQIDGVPVKNIFKSFKIFRAERRAEVIAAGAIQLGMALSNDFPSVRQNSKLTSYFDNWSASGNINLYEVNGFTGAVYYKSTSYNSIVQYNNAAIKRNIASFYSPDLLFNNDTYTRIINDKLIVFGQYKVVPNGNLVVRGTSFTGLNYYRIYSSENMALTATSIDISDSVFIDSGQTNTIGGISYTKKFPTLNNGQFTAPYVGTIQGSDVLLMSADALNNNSNDDLGFYQSLIFRRTKDKYGSPTANNVVVFTGLTIQQNESFGDAYGGDVFTQQTWLKNRLPVLQGTGTTVVPFILGGLGYNIPSQNRVNTNLRIWDSTDNTQLIYPLSTRNSAAWLESSAMDYIEQNSAYKIINQVQARVVYDPSGQDTTQYLSRKWYSELKPNGSKVDFYRIFLPLNFQDNPQQQGSIYRVLNVNNELFTVQERGYTREYFNSRGRLVSPDQGEILIGDGSVLSRVGNNLTMFGSSNAGSVVIGKSQSGKDVVMFISTQFGQVLRFGDDGLVSVSLRERMRTFFNNNLKWAQEAKTPADGFGICGVWDNNNKQFIYTVKAWRQVDNWSVAATYNQGAIVQKEYDNQGVAKLWVLTATSSRGDLPGSSPVWQLIPTTDNNYYNVYTFTWSELKNAFTQFYSYLPNHYAEWNGTFLTSYPDLELPPPPTVSRRSLTYQHGIGNPAEYYGIKFPGGKVSVVCNWQRDLNKKFFSLMLNGKGKPERVDITSLFRDENDDEIIKVSFLLNSDFETRESYSYAPVKLELDANGSNDGDTGQIEGIWAKFTITYPVGKKSSLTTFVAYIRDSFRNFTR
jgi:hypothetical protein